MGLCGLYSFFPASSSVCTIQGGRRQHIAAAGLKKKELRCIVSAAPRRAMAGGPDLSHTARTSPDLTPFTPFPILDHTTTKNDAETVTHAVVCTLSDIQLRCPLVSYSPWMIWSRSTHPGTPSLFPPLSRDHTHFPYSSSLYHSCGGRASSWRMAMISSASPASARSPSPSLSRLSPESLSVSLSPMTNVSSSSSSSSKN